MKKGTRYLQLEATITEFGNAVDAQFRFLETDHHYSKAELKWCNGEHYDCYALIVYTSGTMAVNISWIPMVPAVSIHITLDSPRIRGKMRHVFFEPFLEFVTNGKEPPLCPFKYPFMSRQAPFTDKRQKEAFKNGVGALVKTLASRLRENYSKVFSADADLIRQYQSWYETGSPAAPSLSESPETNTKPPKATKVAKKATKKAARKKRDQG